METTNKLVQFKFAADSEMGVVISQFERLIALTKEGTTISGQHTKAIQEGAKVIVQSLGTITQSQQQTNAAITQTVAAVNQQTQAIRQGTAQQTQAINQVSSSVGVLGNSLNDAKNLITGAFALHEIKQFGLGVIDAKSKIDVFRLGLTQMLQSQKDVSELFPKLLELAKATPFQVEGLMQTTIRLKAMGVATEELIPTLVTLGNAASVIGTEKLPLVAKAYTDVMNKGKLMKQEINQFAENGIPIYDLLAVSMGKTRAEIIKLAEDHKLAFSDIKKALEDASSEGGRYYNMMNIQAQTLAGRVSNLKDAYFIAKATIGDFFEGTISKGIDFTQKLIKETIGSSDALNRTLNIVKSAVAAWTTYTTIVNLAQIRTTALSVAVAAKEVVMKAAQIVAGTYNIAMQALNNVISVNYNVTTASTAAARTFWATLASNPLGLVIAAVGVATSAYYAYKAAATETATSIMELARENNKEIGQLEVKKQAILQAVLATTAMKEGTEGYKKSLDTLIKTYPEYFGELNKEEANNKRIWQIYRQVNSELERKIRLMTLEAVQQETQKKAVEVGQELYKVQTQLVALGLKGIDVYDKTNIALQLQNEYRKANQASIGTDVQQSSQQIELLKKANTLNGDYNKLISDTNKALLQTNTVRNDAYRQEIARLDGLLKANKITKEQYVELERKAQEEILNIVAKSKQEELNIADDGNKKKKAKAVLTAKEIAVLTKEIQQDSFKDQIALIDAQMKLDIERANHVKKSRAEVEKEVIRIVEAAEAEKAALRKKYSDMMLASTKETDTDVAISSKELAEILKFDMKEVEKEKKKTEAEKRKENKQTQQEWEQYQRDIQRITKETAKVEQDARRDGVRMAMDYLAAQGGVFGELGRVARKAFDDIDLINGKTVDSYAKTLKAAQENAESTASIFGAGSEQYNQSRVQVAEANKNLTEAQAAMGKAKAGLIMMVAEVIEGLKNMYFQGVIETNKAVVDSMLRTRDILKTYYNDILTANRENLKAELEAFRGTHEEKIRMIREFYTEQKRLSENRDAIDNQITFNARMLEINTETTSKISSAWDLSKGPLGPQQLFKVLMTWKEHNAQMEAAELQRDARAQQLRQQRIQEEVDAARQIRDANIEAIRERAEAERDALEKRIDEIQKAADAEEKILKDSIESSKDDYRKQVDIVKQAYSDQVDALKEKHRLERDSYNEQVDAIKDAYSKELDALREKQSAEKTALQELYDFKRSQLEQTTADETEAITIVDRLRNEAVERYRVDEVARLTATRDRILATLTDESERATVTAEYNRQIQAVHDEVEQAKLDKSKGVLLATKQLRQEEKDESTRLKNEEKTELERLDDEYQAKFKELAAERDAKLEEMSLANKEREKEQKAELAKLEEEHDAKLKKMSEDQYAREQFLQKQITQLETDTATKIQILKQEIANKDKQAKDAMTFENQKYRDFVIQANKDMLESQKAMYIAQLQAEIAMLKGKKNIFNSGRINSAIGDLEQAIRDIEGAGSGAQGLGDFFTEKIKNIVIGERKAAKTPFNSETLAPVTEAYDRDGNLIQLTYVDEDREFIAYDKNKNAFKIRNATGFVEKTGETFFKGTNYLDLGGNPSGVDTIPAIVGGSKLVHLDEGERILSREDNEKIGGKSVSNQTVVEGFKVFETLSKNFSMVDFSSLASVKLSMPKNIKPKDDHVDKRLLEEMRAIRQELANGLVKINIDSDAVSVERVSGQLTQKYYNQFKNS
ncbi:tape measure protein [Runella zeae]|uniref:tape measure protein n=1 Tax=Runella zeae TaxID=94255 RepID=UPI00041C486D|nr:tape measure protein [Runella zeae]